MFKVTVSDKSGQQSKLDFRKPEISIGRMKGNDIVLPKGNVSKRHATIYLRDNSFYVNDHGSTNGTYINGRKVLSEQLVAEGEKIYIGDFILQLDASANDLSGPPQGRHTLPPQPPLGMTSDERMPQNTVFDLGDDLPRDPLRDTYTTLPPDADSGRSDGYPHVPDGIRDTIGAHDDQLGPPAGRYVAVPYTGGGGDTSPPPSAPVAPPRPPGREPVAPSGPVAPSRSTPLPPSRGIAMQPAASPETARRPNSPVVPASPSSPGGEGKGSIQLHTSPPQLQQDFDEALYAKQADLIKLLVEKYPTSEWPTTAPVEDEQAKKRFERELGAALKSLSPPAAMRAKLEEILSREFHNLGILDALLEEESIRDIYVNRHDQVLIRSQGALIQNEQVFSSQEVLEVIGKRLLAQTDSPDDLAAEIRLAQGARLHIVMPPLAAQGPVITVRKPPSSHPSIMDLVDQSVLSAGMADFLMNAIDAGRSIAIVGPTSSGKTTLMSALAQLIHDGIRIVSIEDYGHIHLDQSSAVRLEVDAARGYDKRFLLRQALSMHPQRILLDECRSAEAYDWVTGVASGTEGSLMTVHGVNALDALGRLESLCLLGSSDLSPRGIREQIARAVNIVVTTNRTSDGAVRVQQIAELQGVDLDAFRLNDIFYFRIDGATGDFHSTGYIPLFYEDLRQFIPDLDFSIFQE